MTNHHVIIALYKFVDLPDAESFGMQLLNTCNQLEIKGTFLVATEGLNGTVAGSREAIDQLLCYLKNEPRFSDLSYKESYAEIEPFQKMKVKLKEEIVTLKVPGIDPTKKVGTYVKPNDWNALIRDPETLVIDTRNHYEYELGTFEHAIDPMTENFRDFPEYVKQQLDPQKHKKVAMFCTGGIRCEKATAFMLEQGFETVYHLEGGILQYLQDIPKEESLWKGDCFVFDERIAVDHHLQPCDYVMCKQCDEVVSKAAQESIYFEEGVSCPRCVEH